MLDGTRCFGRNDYGQLGYGYTANLNSAAAAVDVNLGTGLYAVSVIAGGLHTCAILNNSNLLCWGASNYGKYDFSIYCTCTTRVYGDSKPSCCRVFEF
jgi:alpha-tubulin suppressor-like RCC1 family protein